jgi:hypothetical protein
MKYLPILLLFVSSIFTTDALSQELCIDENLINIFDVCIEVFEPVCGCDGITYSNSCVATNFFGITSFTEGICENIVEVFPCDDLGDVDFGECDMVLGVAMQNGVCTYLSGCGWEVNGVDYSPAFYDSIDACNADCGDNGVGCYTDAGTFYLPGEVLEVSDIWCENYTCSPVDIPEVNYEFILNADLYPWECDPIWEDGCYADDGTFYLPGEVLEVSDIWCENYTCIPGFAGFMFLLNSELYPWECDPIGYDGCYADDGTFYLPGEVLEVSDIWCENYTCSPVDIPEVNYEFILNADLYPWECDPIWYDGCYADDGTFYLPGEVLEVSDIWCENYTCIAGFAGFMFLLNSDFYPWECEIDPNLGCFEDGEFFPVGASYYISECEYILCEGDMDWSAIMVIDDCEPNDCIDTSLIDLNAACYDLWDPVCGCDGVTYSNECYAINFAGVTSFTPGPCNDVPGGCTYIQALNYQPDASWDDGSCLFAPCNSDCTGDVDGDSSVTVSDILQLLGNFGSICQ